MAAQPSASSSQANLQSVAPETIDLEVMLLLMNYYRSSTNPHTVDLKLSESSLSNPEVWVSLVKRENHHASEHVCPLFEREPGSSSSSDNCQTRFEFAPNATAAVRALSAEQLDTLYHQTMAINGCYESIYMLKYFFQVVDKDRKFTIHPIGEETASSVDPRLMETIQIRLRYFNTHTSIYSTQNGSGARFFESGIPPNLFPHPKSHLVDYERHYVAVIPRVAGDPDPLVYDLSRMQYGPKGRGIHGETYFVGEMSRFVADLHTISRQWWTLNTPPDFVPTYGPESTMRLQGAVTKALSAWSNRRNRGWCNYCGRPEDFSGLISCGACKIQKVFWCNEEHRGFRKAHHDPKCEGRVVGT